MQIYICNLSEQIQDIQYVHMNMTILYARLFLLRFNLIGLRNIAIMVSGCTDKSTNDQISISVHRDMKKQTVKSLSLSTVNFPLHFKNSVFPNHELRLSY